jgi:CheY-like chemotaxis protein
MIALGSLCPVAEVDEVTVAFDGEQALERYRAVKPDGIVVDIFLPRMDGVDLIRALRRDFADARIIGEFAVSQELLDRDVLSVAHRAGANHALWKPIEPRTLVAAVADVLTT